MVKSNKTNTVSYRKQKIEKLIKRHVMKTMIEITPDVNSIILITNITLSNNLRNATLGYIFRQQNNHNHKNIEQTLTQVIPHINKTLSQSLRTKFLPKILFKYDNFQENTNHILSILEGIKTDQRS